MKRVLLTGGSGFIGRNIKEQLGKVYELLAPSSKELDLLHMDAVGKYIRQYKITDIIHTAVYNQRRRDINPQIDLSCNLRMFYNLIEYAGEIDKIIYFGSGAEYDKRYPIQNFKEEDFGRRIPNLNDYSLSKYIMNLEARKSNNIYNLRLFGVYGRYENHKACFPSHLCLSALKGKTLTIRQNCIFDFLYVDDLITSVKWVLENKPQYQDYNVCTASPIELLKMAEIVKDISGQQIEVACLMEGMNLEYTGDNRRLNKEIEWRLTPVEFGLKKLFEYYKGREVLWRE